MIVVARAMKGKEFLYSVNANWSIDFTSGTCFFTFLVTNTTTDGWEWVLSFD